MVMIKCQRMFVSLLLFFLSGQAIAGEVGAIVGFRTDDLTSENGTRFSPSYGYQLGVVGLLPLNNTFNFRSGFVFAQRVVKRSSTLYYFSVDATDRTSTLDFPILLQANLLTGLYVFGGLSYSVALNHSCKVQTEGVICNATKTVDDVPLEVGVGYDFYTVSDYHLKAEAEYDYGTRNSGPDTPFRRGVTINLLGTCGF